MQKDDVLMVIDDVDPGWWEVKDVNGKQGIIPANYVEEEEDYESYDEDVAGKSAAAADAASQHAHAHAHEHTHTHTRTRTRTHAAPTHPLSPSLP